MKLTYQTLLIQRTKITIKKSYMARRIKLLFIFIFAPLSIVQAQLKPEVADQIVALVSGNPILKSEIDAQVFQIMQQARIGGQQVSFSEELWYNILEGVIDSKVLLEKAKIDSVVVSDEDVNRRMDLRIQQLVQQAGSELALEQAFGKSIIQLRAEYREQFREDITSETVRRNKIRSITITRPEVFDFFNSIPPDSLPIIPEQVSISQIVSLPPPKTDAKQAAYEFAQQLRDSIITHGKSIEELARRHSDGPSGPNGGLLPSTKLGDFVSEYSAAASALQPGQISEVVETTFGFHVIRLNKRVADEIETNHILIMVDGNELDDQFSIDKLNAIRDSIVFNLDYKFSDFARRHSEDPQTSSLGGKVTDPRTGENVFVLQALDPELYRVVLLMDEVGQISLPRSFNPNGANSGKAFRIVRLDRRIEEHKASLDLDFERFEQIALQQKQARVMGEWIKDLRKDIYIEYKIPTPEKQ